MEGGAYINYGHEDWWPFGGQGLFSEGLAWRDVPSHSHTIQQSYVWSLIDEYVADATWAPTSSFVTTGEGSGDNKAATGASETAAIAYFPPAAASPSTRPCPARQRPARWYDPTNGTFTTIAGAEAPEVARAVTMPGDHGDGTQDWVLVVDSPSRVGT